MAAGVFPLRVAELLEDVEDDGDADDTDWEGKTRRGGCATRPFTVLGV